jgi:hypothetical protein
MIVKMLYSFSMLSPNNPTTIIITAINNNFLVDLFPLTKSISVPDIHYCPILSELKIIKIVIIEPKAIKGAIGNLL